MGFQWIVRPTVAFEQLANAQAAAIEADIVALAHNLTGPITDHMKSNAPWQDRTGQARASLYSAVFHEVRQAVTILVSHGTLVEYGVFLETMQNGRFQIIAPTIDIFGPQVMRGVQEIVRRHMR